MPEHGIREYSHPSKTTELVDLGVYKPKPAKLLPSSSGEVQPLQHHLHIQGQYKAGLSGHQALRSGRAKPSLPYLGHHSLWGVALYLLLGLTPHLSPVWLVFTQHELVIS